MVAATLEAVVVREGSGLVHLWPLRQVPITPLRLVVVVVEGLPQVKDQTVAYPQLQAHRRFQQYHPLVAAVVAALAQLLEKTVDRVAVVVIKAQPLVMEIRLPHLHRKEATVALLDQMVALLVFHQEVVAEHQPLAQQVLHPQSQEATEEMERPLAFQEAASLMQGVAVVE